MASVAPSVVLGYHTFKVFLGYRCVLDAWFYPLSRELEFTVDSLNKYKKIGRLKLLSSENFDRDFIEALLNSGFYNHPNYISNI